MQCKRGSGVFQWNKKGWFGGQIGSTCWLLFSVFRLDSWLASIILITCFLASNLVGTVLWMNRDRLDPYKAIQVLLAETFLFAAIAMISMDCIGVLKDLDPRINNPSSVYLLLLIFPALAVLLHLRSKTKQPETNS